MLWVLLLFRSITVTSARYLSVKTQAHVSTGSSACSLPSSPSLSLSLSLSCTPCSRSYCCCPSLGRLISKRGAFSQHSCCTSHTQSSNQAKILKILKYFSHTHTHTHTERDRTPLPNLFIWFCSVKRRSFWLHLPLLLPDKYRLNAFHFMWSTCIKYLWFAVPSKRMKYIYRISSFMPFLYII